MNLNPQLFWQTFHRSAAQMSQLLDEEGKPVNPKRAEANLKGKVERFPTYEELLQSLLPDPANLYLTLAILFVLRQASDEPMREYTVETLNGDSEGIHLFHGNVTIAKPHLLHSGHIFITGGLKVNGVIQNAEDYSFVVVGGNVACEHIWQGAGSWLMSGGNIKASGLIWVDDEAVIVAPWVSARLAIEGTLGTSIILSSRKEFGAYFQAEEMSDSLEQGIERLKKYLDPELFEGGDPEMFPFPLHDRLMAEQNIWRK